MQACGAGYALTYVTSLKLQLVTWTIVGLTATKFKPLVLPSAWFLIAQYHVHLDMHACALHSLIMLSYK
jgi:hypothetical protein